jgi:hypothetical protein
MAIAAMGLMFDGSWMSYFAIRNSDAAVQAQ